MTQQQLDREVANFLGEDVREISRRGFSIADPAVVDFDLEPDDLPAQTLDWDYYHLGGPSPVMSHVDAFLD